jgi:hypothetical protein
MKVESIEKSRYSLDMFVGTFCLILLAPTIIIAWGEFRDIIDYFEYGGDMGDVWRWLLYTITIISILLVTGLHFLGMLRSNSSRLGSGVFILLISLLNLLSRLSDFDTEMKNRGIDEFWLSFIYWPSTHERLELVILGIIIGFFVIKEKEK